MTCGTRASPGAPSTAFAWRHTPTAAPAPCPWAICSAWACAALLHEPELVLLDEPANGLDPAGVVEVRDLLRTLAHEQGVTVFMSSHVLAEVERLATRIGIIHRGRLLQELEATEIEQLRARRLVVDAEDRAAAGAALAAAGYSAATDNETGAFVLSEMPRSKPQTRSPASSLPPARRPSTWPWSKRIWRNTFSG